MEGPNTPGGGGFAGWKISPPTSGVKCGIGCTINVNERGELVIKKVIPGGPAALSCEIGLDDVLVRVDGVSVEGDTTDDVARRIVGPSGFPISITVRHRNRLGGMPETVESTVVLLRQQTVTIPERLAEGLFGLGVEMQLQPNGERRIVNVKQGGTAQLSGKVKVGDHVIQIDGRDVRGPLSNAELSALLTGPPFSRVTLLVRRGGVEPPGAGHVVRSVVLIGEFLMKHDAYKDSLKHAILQPQPPSATGLSQQHLSRAHAQSDRRPGDGAGGASGARARVVIGHTATGQGREGVGAPATPGVTGVGGLMLEQVMGSSDALLGMRHVGSGDAPEAHPSPNAAHSPLVAGTVAGSLESSLTGSVRSGYSESWGGSSGASYDGAMSRSSTASRDSIAGIVRERFESRIDSIRTVEGREATFAGGWPHAGNPRLSPSRMALAGFVFYPDGEADDKVMCAYCGLELGQWEASDDPQSAHHDASPGCTFWRKSSSGAALPVRPRPRPPRPAAAVLACPSPGAGLSAARRDLQLGTTRRARCSRDTGPRTTRSSRAQTSPRPSLRSARRQSTSVQCCDALELERGITARGEASWGAHKPLPRPRC